jgi:hypothetical protein
MTEDLTEPSWQEELINDIEPKEISSLVVYSRDWTVETIASQIRGGNIDLNPGFQRGNAWNDELRSRLIESLIINFPVPEIVFAEKMDQKQSFIVLDGKQRLLTIAGFMFPSDINYWTKPALSNLRVRKDLDGVTFAELSQNSRYKDEHRQLLNADVRCTIISGYETDDLLYEIFFRLNTTSVPLNPQELRQALYRGPFADYLAEISGQSDALEQILGSERTNTRARDADLILRFLSFAMFGENYNGNLRTFLDGSMKKLNEEWLHYEDQVRGLFEEFNLSLKRLIEIFGHHVGRRFVNEQWEGRFNKVLFEVEAYYFMHVADHLINEDTKAKFLEGFKDLCEENLEFLRSIESTTKTPSRYEARFRLFRELVNRVFSLNITVAPITLRDTQLGLLLSS